VYGQYFVGEDQCLGESLASIAFCSDTKRDLGSITKSVTSLLVGIAIDRKLIKDVDALLLDHFPEHAGRRAEKKWHSTPFADYVGGVRVGSGPSLLTLGLARRKCSNRRILSAQASTVVTPPGSVFC
jgi:hypothetical protein